LDRYVLFGVAIATVIGTTMGTVIGFCKEVLSGFEVDEMGRSWLKWAQVAALRVYCCDRGGKSNMDEDCSRS
jgi:hypothetical protein